MMPLHITSPEDDTDKFIFCFVTHAVVNINGSMESTGMLSIQSLYIGTGGLTIEGSLAASSPNVIVTSDRRLKQNIEPLSNSMDKISKLKGVYYKWNNDAKLTTFSSFQDENRHIGLIAQEVREVIPEAVYEIGNKYLGIEYNGLIPVLIDALNEMREKIIPAYGSPHDSYQISQLSDHETIQDNLYPDSNQHPIPFDDHNSRKGEDSDLSRCACHGEVARLREELHALRQDMEQVRTILTQRNSLT